ncbi:hypothetical protein [Calycomorphotria hydatis]|uniref:Uncharacterized protein n=1 Tax=Calycomorphotria hydatis TaxID=2528027 RepID=A0A517T8Q8_9PLAN|nr:hypothetical protein [Calycomorphotria hydatis]QDT64770.1 hypothetical protein V22_20110 [Calycomorphotria hydatis]
MAWEKRQRGRRYYYRSRRVDGRVVKEYFGTGPTAELAAAVDKKTKEKRDLERLQARKLSSEIAAIDTIMRDMDKAITVLSQAVLFAAGFHQVNYQWRFHHDS